MKLGLKSYPYPERPLYVRFESDSSDKILDVWVSCPESKESPVRFSPLEEADHKPIVDLIQSNFDYFWSIGVYPNYGPEDLRCVTILRPSWREK